VKAPQEFEESSPLAHEKAIDRYADAV